jgi:hypothetical protein
MIRVPALKFVLFMTSISMTNCAEKLVNADADITKKKEQFLSSYYNHFKDGLIVKDIAEGVELLWRASFKNGYVYKENLGLLLHEGLLIAPNELNTRNRTRLSIYNKSIKDGKLFVLYNGHQHQVLAILHTHPEGTPIPSPRHDFQYAYIGIHNFVISQGDIYDAFKDKKGNEVFRRIGDRSATEMILAVINNEPIDSEWQTHHLY